MRKRAEIADEIEHTKKRLRELVAELDHLDHAIRIINPRADVSLVRLAD